MQSTTAVAVAGTLTSAQAHIELIARIFAETGVKSLFKGLLQLLVENPQEPRVLRSQGSYVPMDPRSWDADLDVAVNVVIGGGMPEERVAVLADVATKQESIFNTMGLANPLVTVKQYRDTLVKMLKLRGRQDADAFFQPVDPNWQPPPPPTQDPNMVIAQAEQMKAETHRMEAQAKAQLEQQKHQAELEDKIRELEIKMLSEKVDADLQREKMAVDAQTKIAVAEIQFQAELNQQKLNHAIDQMEAHMDHAAQAYDSGLKAQATVAAGAKEVEVEHDEQGRVKRLRIKHPPKEEGTSGD
jgi:hypothetical protein